MPPYIPRRLGRLSAPEEVQKWIEDELSAIAQSTTSTTLIGLQQVNKDIDKPRDGMLISADGVNFNPGGGAGTYERVSGAWKKLGGSTGVNVFPSGTVAVSFDSVNFGAPAADLQVNDTTPNTALGVSLWGTIGTGPKVMLERSRGAAVATHAIVQNNDVLGIINFAGDDGTLFRESSTILALVDGVPAAGSMPGRLMFQTTRPGTINTIERVRIDSRGNVALNMQGTLATNAVDGFTFIPTCPGVPTGVPTAYGGQVPLVYDTTDDRLYVYDAGWKNFNSGVTTDFFINAAVEFGVSPANTAATNSTLIQNALNAASISSGRGVVVLPSGILQISAQITIPAGITLAGQGRNATIIQQTVSVASFFLMVGSYSCICDLGMNITAGHTATDGVLISGTQVTECLITRLNIDADIGGVAAGVITNAVRMAGTVGGYFNRVKDCRINDCTNGVSLTGTNALEAVLESLNIGSGLGRCAIGINATVNSGYFSMIKVETNAVTDCGLFSQDCNYTAVDCLMDASNNFGFLSLFTTTTGMPITGWYLRFTNCRASNSQVAGTSHGLGSGGSGFVIQNQLPASAIVNVNMSGCQSFLNAQYGYVINASSTPANTRVTLSGCSAYAEATAQDADGMSFNFVNLALSGCSAFDCGKFGPHTADGIMVSDGCTGRVVGCVGSGNTSQQVNITPASAVLGLNNTSTNTRTVAQLPSAVTVGANSRAYVTDATAVTFSTVVVGLGVSVVPVYSDGTVWRIG